MANNPSYKEMQDIAFRNTAIKKINDLTADVARLKDSYGKKKKRSEVASAPTIQGLRKLTGFKNTLGKQFPSDFDITDY